MKTNSTLMLAKPIGVSVGVMAQDARNALFMGSLIGSGVGFLLLIATEFGGWSYYSSYYGIYVWGSVGPNGPLGFLGMFVLGLPLLYCAVVSLKGVRNPDSVTQGTVSRAFKLSILQLALVFVGSIVFVIGVSGSEWWFGAGFYGSAIGGILTAIFLSSARKSYAGTVPTPHVSETVQGFQQGYGQPQQYSTSDPQQQSPATHGFQAAAGPVGRPSDLPSPQTHPQPIAPEPASAAPAQPTPSPQPIPVSPRFCRQCGGPLPPGARFCRSCGTAILQNARSQPSPP